MSEEIKQPTDLPEERSEGVRGTGEIRRIVVDRAACIGARSCSIVAPGVYQMDDEDLAYVVTDDLDAQNEELIKMGAESCPVLAIHLYDKEGNKIFPEQ